MNDKGKIRVLITDDHALVRDGLKVILGLSNDIEIAGEMKNGKEAFEFFSESTADVVLMDINMPVMNGVEATRAIHEKYPDVKILALSMHNSPEYFSQMSAAGASGYLLKNARMEIILEAIRAVHSGQTYFRVEEHSTGS